MDSGSAKISSNIPDFSMASFLQSLNFDERSRNQKRCHYMPQGRGGIFTVPMNLAGKSSTSDDVTSICTTGCSTCVGVYIPIDEKRFFAAHIDGAIRDPNAGQNRRMVAWQISNSLAVSFKRAVRAGLDRTFKHMDREVKTIRQSNELKRRAVIVCFWPVVGGITGPGPHAIDVLCDYFDLDRATVVDPYTAHHGFIIDHSQRIPPIILGWTRPGPTPWVMDEIAKIAEKCNKPVWGDNFWSVLTATYEYVFPGRLGWEDETPPKDGTFPWCIEYVANT
ncbi:hypothetical protein TI39_contig852g00001, partial [Zymoseptoria brevis]